MNHFRKIITILLSLSLALGSGLPGTLADDGGYSYGAQAQTLNDLGLYKGISETTFDPDLGTALSREAGVVMLLRIFGLEADAQALPDSDITSTLAKFSDVSTISSWARASVAYAVKNNLVLGMPDGSFQPKESLSGKAYCTLILRQLGFDPNYNSSPATLAEKGGLTPDQLKAFTDKELIKDDLVGISFGSLSAVDKSGAKVIDNLVATKVVDESLAVAAGLVTPPSLPIELSEAITLNHNTLEVTLKNATDETTLNAATFKIVDTKQSPLEITNKILAPYDSEHKTLLVTLKTSTVAGALYTLTHNSSSINFVGKGTDTTKPTVTAINAIDYNVFSVDFSEAIGTEGTITAAEKYGTKSKLETLKITYFDKDTLTIETAPQKGATLYALDIKNFKDLAGNTMDADSAKVLTGILKSTEYLQIAEVKALDYNKVYVNFNVNVDPSTLKTSAFSIGEAYGTKTAFTIDRVTPPTADDTLEFSTSNDTPAKKSAAIKKGAIVYITTAYKSSTLYKLEALADLKTLYGISRSTTPSEVQKTFVGISKPDTTFSFGSSPIIVVNSNTIKVPFDRKLDKDLATALKNYTIDEMYGSKTPLAIESVELLSDQKTVKIKTATSKSVLYKLTISNLKDIYGNLQKTGTDAAISYAGKAPQDKITAISTITRTNDTTIRVKFNALVGNNATDVSLYNIDNGVGYPQSATIDSEALDTVVLVIPKTIDGKIYTLTVKGLNNSDSVAMSSTPLTASFNGRGSASGLPLIQAVMATDNHTIKVYFDRDVTDATIANGVLWSPATNSVNTFFELRANKTGAGLVMLNGLKGYQDPVDKNALTIIDNAASWARGEDFSTYFFSAGDAYTQKLKFDNNETRIEVACNNTAYEAPKVDALTAIDNHAIKIYFTKPVASVSGNIQVVLASAPEANLTEGTAVPVSGSNSREWLLPISEAMTSAAYKATFTTSAITDLYATDINLDDENTAVNLASLVKEFAGNSTSINYITDVYAVMTDKQTIQVYFPEAMYYNANVVTNGAASPDVDATGNYTLKQTDGEGALAGATPPLKFIAYDTTLNKATLHLGSALDTSITQFGLVLNSAIANITSTKSIAKSPTSNANLVVTVAANHSEPNLGPAIAAAEISGDRTTLTLTMSEPTALGLVGNYAIDSDATLAASELPDKSTTTGYYLDPEILLGAFNIYTTSAGYLEAANLSASGIESATLSSNGKVITIKFNLAVQLGSIGYITTKVGEINTAATLFSYCGVTRSQTENESKVHFAAPGVTTYDYTKPKSLSTTGTSNIDANDTPATGDKIILRFNEEMDSTAMGTLFNVVFTDGANNVITIYKGATSTDAADKVATITLTGGDWANGEDLVFNSTTGAWTGSNTLLTLTLPIKTSPAAPLTDDTIGDISIILHPAAVDSAGNKGDGVTQVGLSEFGTF